LARPEVRWRVARFRRDAADDRGRIPTNVPHEFRSLGGEAKTPLTAAIARSDEGEITASEASPEDDP
jgi:hypothetical protein